MGEVTSYTKTGMDALIAEIEGAGFATVADVDTAVAGLVDAAPGTLDTLNELAAALGDDSNFASTITTSLAAKASTTALATETTDRTAADVVLTAAQLVIVANNQTGTAYGPVLADAGKVIELNNAATITVTIPLNATQAFPIGTVIELWQQGAGQVVVAAAGGVTIRSTEGKLKLYGQYAAASLRKRGSDEWVLVGDLVA